MSRADLKKLTAMRENKENKSDLPAEISEFLDNYAPRNVDPEHHDAVVPVVREIITKAEITGLEEAKRRASDVAKYLDWRRMTGQEFDLASSMTFIEIDRYYKSSVFPSTKSANTVRSRLRSLAQKVSGLDAAPTSPTYGKPPPRPPYTMREEARICKAVLHIRSEISRRHVCMIVGLALGAGLGPEDIRVLRFRDISIGEDGIRVDVGGKVPRTVWVRAHLEVLIMVGAEGRQGHRLVIGGEESQRNPVAGILESAEVFDAPKIETSRLRHTWIVRMMERDVPLPLLMEASGLRSARTLVELVEYVEYADGPDPKDVLR